jgi:ZIP family zinc transporter
MLYLPELGLTVAVAIAIHNIPEGMTIAIPACLSGASKLSVFLLALFSGLAGWCVGFGFIVGGLSWSCAFRIGICSVYYGFCHS